MRLLLGPPAQLFVVILVRTGASSERMKINLILVVSGFHTGHCILLVKMCWVFAFFIFVFCLFFFLH